MIEDLTKLSKVLDDKVKPMVSAIEKADPTKEEYGILLSNFSLTMNLATNINRTLLSVAERAKAIQEEMEEEKDESNN